MSRVTEDVLRLVCGVTTVAEVAAKYEVAEAEVERWRAQHLRAIERLAMPQPSRGLRTVAVAALVAVAGGVGLLSTEAYAQACAQTLPSPLRTFCADSPAIAAEVNANNAALVSFIEQKVGTVGNANISTGGTLNTGAATVASLNVGGSVNYGQRTGQHLNLYNQQYGIGVQGSTLYARGDSFAWHRGGVHTDTPADPGAGGTRLARLDGAGNFEIAGQLQAASLRQRACSWGVAGPSTVADNQTHSVFCPAGTFAAGWRCDATASLDGNCAMYCCSP